MGTAIFLEEVETAQTYLGPARVIDCADGRLRVSTTRGEGTAVSALGYPYEYAAGDSVLVIGREDYYVIGVLQGKGRTALRVEGDLAIAASGRLSLEAASVEVTGTNVALRAGRLEFAARTVVERFASCFRWVQGLFQTVVGRSRTVVDESCTLQAGRIVQKSRSDVSIDGSQIRLG